MPCAATRAMIPRDLVGYGRARHTDWWPGGARLAVSVVLNYEEGAESSVADGDPASEGVPGVPTASPTVRDVRNESLFEFGSRVGGWRLLDIFAEAQIPITAFACGRALERNPTFAQALAAAGHEAAGHGYRWVRYRSLSREDQRADIHRAVEAITATTGQRPRGYFARDYGAEIRELLVEEGGFVYDSHAFNDEMPYFVETKGARLVVVPYAADTNDVGMDLRPAFPQAGAFQNYLIASFERLHREAQRAPRMMTVALHARTSGLPARAGDVAGFLAHARSHGDVWFARRLDIANHWIAAQA